MVEPGPSGMPSVVANPTYAVTSRAFSPTRAGLDEILPRFPHEPWEKHENPSFFFHEGLLTVVLATADKRIALLLLTCAVFLGRL